MESEQKLHLKVGCLNLGPVRNYTIYPNWWHLSKYNITYRLTQKWNGLDTKKKQPPQPAASLTWRFDLLYSRGGVPICCWCFRSSWSTRCNMVAIWQKPLRKQFFFRLYQCWRDATKISLHAPPSERKIYFKVVLCHLNCLNNGFPLIPQYNCIKYCLNIRNHHQDVKTYLKSRRQIAEKFFSHPEFLHNAEEIPTTIYLHKPKLHKTLR